MAAAHQQHILPFDDRQRQITKDLSTGQDTQSEVSTENPEMEIMEGRTDIEGLLAYLDQLQQKGIQLQEATHIGNRWYWKHMIPFEHFGFLFSTSAGEYFSLDFGRTGIYWDVYDDYPDFPDDTFLAASYRMDYSENLKILRSYCQETKPFVFLYNDCKSWCNGLREILKMESLHNSSSTSKQQLTQPGAFGACI